MFIRDSLFQYSADYFDSVSRALVPVRTAMIDGVRYSFNIRVVSVGNEFIGPFSLSISFPGKFQKGHLHRSQVTKGRLEPRLTIHERDRDRYG
jgi:hypothetical protein